MYRKEECPSILKDPEHIDMDDQNEKASTLKWHKVHVIKMACIFSMNKKNIEKLTLFCLGTLVNSGLAQKMAAASEAEKCTAILL